MNYILIELTKDGNRKWIINNDIKKDIENQIRKGNLIIILTLPNNNVQIIKASNILTIKKDEKIIKK